MSLRLTKRDRPWRKTFARRLRIARKARGLSQAALGALLDPSVSAPAVTQWEAGKGTAPLTDYLIQLADVLGVSMDWLSGKGPEETPNLAAGEAITRDALSAAHRAMDAFLSRPGRRLDGEDRLGLLLALCDWISLRVPDDGRIPSPDALSAYLDGLASRAQGESPANSLHHRATVAAQARAQREKPASAR